MEKKISLQFPLCSPDNLICARLMASAVCSLIKLGIDDAEDIKVCVNEACLIMMSEKYQTVSIDFVVGDELKINVCGQGQCEIFKEVEKSSKELGLILLNSLLDKVDYYSEGGVVSSISLIKRIEH